MRIDQGDAASMSASVRTTGIRVATPNDIDAVTAIERASFTQPWSRRSFAELVTSPRVTFLVAERAGPERATEVIGYAILYFHVDQGELANLAVATDGRGLGIGRKLLNGVLERALRQGLREIFLEVRASNDVAQSLYASLGFVPIARRKRYYQQPIEDALVLKLELSANRSTDGSGARRR